MRYIKIIAILTLFLGCKSQTSETSEHEHTNDLINETSPYLLQHAHNPVDWKAWSDKTLDKAKSEDKLMIISVGYSACHWCHVMEKESFEDSLVAQVMNENYVNIKVDREERPDVDQAYMNALYLMTNGRGGWPLNIVALPDGRPIWGETYLTKEQWLRAIEQIAKLYKDDPNKLFEQANNIEQGIKSIDMVELNTDEAIFNKEDINKAVEKWSERFDNTLGGASGEPKFMMPNNYQFLLRYAYQTNNKDLLDHVNLTLTKIAFGGVFDQIGGGFSRYSVDKKWHVPHFEKMLYDNAQLVSLYTDAYALTKNSLYKDIVFQTLDFIKREMTIDNGAFYSSLDADSKNSKDELEEGAYYVWPKEELKNILQNDFNLFSNYYNVNHYGLWEHDNYVLIRKQDDASFLEKEGLSLEDLENKKGQWQQALLKARDERARPRLDDKSLTSWNGLMLQGYVDAFKVFEKSEYLDAALKNANFIKENLIRDDGGLNHTYKEGKSKFNGYLEDYASIIQAYISLYEVTLDQTWLTLANELTGYTFSHFFDNESNMFFFTSNEDKSLVSKNIEYRDNVIPSSNSIMAKNLFKLSHYFDNNKYVETATTMLNNVKQEMLEYPSGYSNWFDLMLNFTTPYYEIAIVGSQAKEKISELNKTYIPNKLIAGSLSENDMPLLKNRYTPEQTLIYVCVNKACKLPVSSVNKAITQLQK